MTTFGFCFRPDLDSDDCSGPLYLWVDHARSTRFAVTRYLVRWNEWDAIAGELVLPIDNPRRRRVLEDFQRGMSLDLARIGEIVRRLGSGGRYTADDILRHWYLGEPGGAGGMGGWSGPGASKRFLGKFRRSRVKI